MDDPKLMQMCLYNESLKLELKENRTIGTMKVSEVDLEDHQLLLVLNEPISEAMVLVQVHVQ
jgi:hypothetical protein